MFNYINYNVNDFKIFIIILFIAVIILFVTKRLLKVSTPYFFMGLLGLIIGLLVGSLIAQPFSKLPGEYGKWLPIVINIFVTVGILDLFLAQAKSVTNFFGKILFKVYEKENKYSGEVIVDTSVLIDGRIESIANTGFISYKLIIPRFILLELQAVADSEDNLKRTRGRRGLEVLTRLQKNKQVSIEIYNDNRASLKKIDHQILDLAKEKNAKILTVDYNLGRIAQIEGMQILNINELAEALKPALIPGEEINVKIIQKGKEKNQGVGYLADGTMIVVENGGKYVGENILCEVVRIFYTAAGKMIFVEPRKK